MNSEQDTSLCKWSVQVNGTCPYKEMFNMIKNSFDIKERCDKNCLNVMLAATGTATELDLIKYLNLQEWLKPHGPAKSTKLLNNFNIDQVLKDFSVASVKKNEGHIFVNGPFYHVPFDMLDFMEMPGSSLRNLDIPKLHSLGFRSFGCVLNTDTWKGPGKHWVCIYGTIPENLKDTVFVEYFNSSGNGLKKFWTLLDWRDKMAENVNIEIAEVNHKPIQESDTECGVWCLFYIKTRLEGKTPDFYINTFDDNDMIKGRSYLFINNPESKYLGL